MRLRSKAGKMVRKTAADVKPPTGRELERLRAAMRGPIDTSDIPERKLPPPHPLIRDAKGLIPRKPSSLIRDAILDELGRRNLSRYQLWKLSRRHCPTLPNSAVYEFLSGRRAINVDYCEAMLKALDLRVARFRKSA